MPYKFKGKRKCTQSDGDKGNYLTIKKGGKRRCYKSKSDYKSAMAWGHGEADEKDDENILREFIAGVLKITLYSGDSLPSENVEIPDPPADSVEELKKVILQYENPTQPEDLQYHLDENMAGLFNDILVDNGIDSRHMEINVIKKEIIPEVMRLKKHFNRIRPSKYAKELNIGWVGDDDQMSTTDSPSYPSGHTAQAYWIAHHLSDDFPVFSGHFFSMAERVAQSRVDRGVHFPSDLDGGRLLAQLMYNKKRGNHGGFSSLELPT